MNEGRDELGGIGTATAALAISGHPQSTENELWNGSSWTEVGDLNTGRHAHGAAGESTLGIIFGGNSGTADGKTESWNGSAWTEINDLSTARAAGGSANASPNKACLYFGGSPAQTTTEEFSSIGTVAVD